MERSQKAAKLTVVVLVTLTTFAVAETKKEYRFNVGVKSTVSIINQYGAVTVRPSTGNYVLVNATTYSDKVEVDQSQSGNRVDVQSHLLPGATADNARVDYEVLVPADASVTLQSTTGPLRAERLQGDVEAEGANATVDVRDISSSHVHVKTMNGPITLSNIHDGHVEVDSVSGDVTLNAVTGPLVRVSSTSGKIRYDGDFGYAGEYRFNSHSGDIDATIPQDASVDVKAQSVHGQVQNDVPLEPKAHTSFLVKEGSSFAGTINKAASSVWLRTFSGKIHLKKR
ncbi:MAG TPA: DUF4097 family beta strand repeat-containing protein [Terriglobales bacterium]|nr:DUF4097 family beta strand repeat-containing protein [Terriglobales bacterium]